MPAVLLVHGIWNSGKQFARLSRALLEAGVEQVETIDLLPNSGSVAIAELAQQVASAVEDLCERTGEERIDLVGFSMGALVCRYFIQRLAGRERVRRFVSIAGPQRGTWLAFFSRLAGVRDMRPRSRTLLQLEAESFGDVELHCLWTPFDLMIVPGWSAVLAGARSVQRFPVLLHRSMLDDPRVIRAVVSILTAGARPVCEDEAHVPLVAPPDASRGPGR